jgi:cytochrome b6-f complex iron-sulfur subunit
VLRAMFGSFLGLGFTALGLAGGLWSAAVARFLMPNAVPEPPSRFSVGSPADYPPGHVETKFKERFGVWVVSAVYQGQRQIYALRTVCTHLGCITLWQAGERKFKCPCHGSGFLADGINFEGPAPRPLERHAIRLADDGQLEVDTSRVFQEELGQWNDPASYVAVQSSQG